MGVVKDDDLAHVLDRTITAHAQMHRINGRGASYTTAHAQIDVNKRMGQPQNCSRLGGGGREG